MSGRGLPRKRWVCLVTSMLLVGALLLLLAPRLENVILAVILMVEVMFLLLMVLVLSVVAVAVAVVG